MESYGEMISTGDVIAGDADATVFNPIASTILNWLRFKVVRWMHDFQACSAMVWDWKLRHELYQKALILY
jgi:hypothetical protein